MESEKNSTSTSSSYLKEALIKDGYEPGLVKVLKDSECSFIIYNVATKAQLDPVNFNISEFEVFRKKDLKIYFKYKPLGMMNRCNEASPVELLSVVERQN